MTGRRGDNTAGFSLIEVLVALAVTGMVVLGTSGLMSLSHDAEGKLGQDAAARDQIIAASRIFRDLVTSAVSSMRIDMPDQNAASGDHLTIKAMGPAIMALDRPAPVRLVVRSQPKGLKALVVAWRDPDTDVDREEVVIDDAFEITFSYFGNFMEQPASWRSAWGDFSVLPKAISLRVHFPSLGPPIDLIVRTFSKFPRVCAALPHEAACRQSAPGVGRAWP